MTPHTALRLAIAALEKEQRLLRQPYELYRRGFTSYQPSNARYLELTETIDALTRLLREP